MALQRCEWCLGNEMYLRYHDEEWGVPLHDDDTHFAMLILESMQAGLSWLTILKRRDNYYQAFADFKAHEVAKFNDKHIADLLQNAGIIRNRKKIEAAVNNAKQFLAVQEQFGSFDKYIWSFTDNKTIKNAYKNIKDIPANSALSDTVSKQLKQLGFKFVGSTIIYSYLQAVGIINDHIVGCFRYNEV